MLAKARYQSLCACELLFVDESNRKTICAYARASMWLMQCNGPLQLIEFQNGMAFSVNDELLWNEFGRFPSRTKTLCNFDAANWNTPVTALAWFDTIDGVRCVYQHTNSFVNFFFLLVRLHCTIFISFSSIWCVRIYIFSLQPLNFWADISLGTFSWVVLRLEPLEKHTTQIPMSIHIELFTTRLSCFYLVSSKWKMRAQTHNSFRAGARNWILID